MLSDCELWACASRMIDEHGLDAPIHAAMRADKLMEQADLDGSFAWQAITRRISRLLRAPATPLH